MNKELSYWEWQCWRRKMNSTNTHFSTEWVKQFLNKDKK